MGPKLSDVSADLAAATDARHHLADGVRRQVNTVFPSHWSFLLGEIALYSFIVLLIPGAYLTLFFDPRRRDRTRCGHSHPAGPAAPLTT